jgi:DNA mismatch repair protein MSH6
MNNPQFSERFSKMASGVPDLERLISRIHAGRCKQGDFLKVLDAFKRISIGFARLAEMTDGFDGSSTGQLIRSSPDLAQYMGHIQAMYTLTDGGESRKPYREIGVSLSSSLPSHHSF